MAKEAPEELPGAISRGYPHTPLPTDVTGKAEMRPCPMPLSGVSLRPVLATPAPIRN